MHIYSLLFPAQFEHYLSVLPPAEREPPQPTADPAAAAAAAASNLLRLPPGAAADADGVYNVTTAQLDEQVRHSTALVGVRWGLPQA